MRYGMLLLGLLLWHTAGAQQLSKTWCPDNGDGTYTNPVLYADYSDPDVVAVGDDYYLTASSFNCIPGLPVLHSKDLVNWEFVGHALGVRRNLKDGERITCYFGAAWSRHDVRTQREWQLRIDETLRNLRHPLWVEW